MSQGIEVPSTADWTWVLTQRCPQCGVNVQELTVAEIAKRGRQHITDFVHALEENPDAGVRPESGAWSMVEYGAHLRDVCVVFRARIKAMLLHDTPSYPDWDQEVAAAEGRYSELSANDVADSLRTRADDIFLDVENLTTEEFQRTGLRSDGHVFTIESLLQYFFHELAHHWWDVSGQRYAD